MNNKISEYMVNLFKCCDELNAEAWGEFLTEDVTFKFANMPLVVGK